MSDNYKLYHRKSGRWVDEIKFDHNYYSNPAGDIVGIDLIGLSDSKEDAAELSDGMFDYNTQENPELKLYEQFNLERIYTSDGAYKYYSKGLNGWLTYISPVTMFKYVNENRAYPTMQFRANSEDGALIVREVETIQWLDENTDLKKVRVF